MTSQTEQNGALSPEKAHELDEIQEKAARKSKDFLNARNADDPFPLVAMATGIGKGRIIHKLIEEQVRDNQDSRILVIVGTKLALVGQTREALEGYNLASSTPREQDYTESEETDRTTDDTEEIDLSELQESSFLYRIADYKRRNASDANVHAATIQTIQSESANGRLRPDMYDLVIVDEAHNIGTTQRVNTIQRFRNVVGFTATPYRHSGVLKEPEQYGFTIVDSLTLPEAQEKDLLPPLLEVPIDTSGLVEKIPMTPSGQIDFKKLEKLLKKSPDLRPFIADELVKHIGGDESMKTVVAVNFVWEAEEIARLLKARGISVGVAVNQNAARAIDSEEIPALDAIERYKLPTENPRSIQVLISPYVASEGFDAPATRAIVWASPTDSTVRYTQFTGRVARRYPGKSYGLVIDFLYQTSQFNWSYNFGQWMKDSVVQLPNGMLFQGSKTQLQRLTRSAEFRRINQTNRPEKTIPVSELQEISELLHVQEAEFAITQTTLHSMFIGDAPKLRKIAQDVISEMQKNNPSLVFSRRNNSNVVTTVANKDLFAQGMLERDVELRIPVIEIQDTDAPINQNFLNQTFRGSNVRLIEVAREIVEEIRKENPDLLVYRRNAATRRTLVITDRNLFIKKMADRGIHLQPTNIIEVQDTDAPITNAFLSSAFVGGWLKLKPRAQEVVEEIRKYHPELIVQRRSAHAFVTVITDKNLFIERMLGKRAIEQKEAREIQETDFAITQRSLREFFAAGQKKLTSVSRNVLEEIKRENPELIAQRKNGTHNIIDVVTDRNLFIQKMAERGIRIRT